jgi:hypothetical protein
MSRDFYRRYKNQKLAVDFVPPAPDPVRKRAYSQLKNEQQRKVPRLLIREPPISILQIARDCKNFANRFGYAVCIADRKGNVLAFSEPE